MDIKCGTHTRPVETYLTLKFTHVIDDFGVKYIKTQLPKAG